MTGDQPSEGQGGGAARFDRYQRHHRWVGFPLAVAYKAFDDRAPYLAALVTYYAFVSLFPLLLLFISVMGFVLQSHPHLRQQIITSAIGDVPAIGSELRQSITGFKGSGSGIAIGIIGVLYGGLGAMQSAQTAFNTIYAVPRNEQPNPLTSRLRSFVLISILGTAIIAISAVTIAVANANSLSARLDISLKMVGYVLIFLLNLAMFTAAFRVLAAVDLGWRDVFAGGLITSAGWEVLQAFGSRIVVHEVNHGTAFYGVFGVVLAVIAWIYLVALVVMFSAEVNVVRARRLWPRALLTPFTDEIDPTEADLACYRSYAEAPRFKGWQLVSVSFEREPSYRRGERPPD